MVDVKWRILSGLHWTALPIFQLAKSPYGGLNENKNPSPILSFLCFWFLL
jgi:hypothetical protein